MFTTPQRTITPTCRKGVLNCWEITRSEVRFVECSLNLIEWREGMKGLAVLFHDENLNRVGACKVEVPMEWSARTFLIYVLRSIRMRNAPVISVVNRLLREEEFG